MDLRRRRGRSDEWAFPPNPKQWPYEKIGINFRDRFKLGFGTPFRPFDLSVPDTTLLQTRREVEEYVDSSLTQSLYEKFADRWSGMTIPCDEAYVVIINETHSRKRNAVTLMEEFMHILLEHRPTKISICPKTGILKREFDKKIENEAYYSAAATLIPYLPLKKFSQSKTPEEIGNHFEVSTELVRMRLKFCKLYRKRRSSS